MPLPDGINERMLEIQQRQRFINREICDLSREDPAVSKFCNLYVCGQMEYGQMLEQLAIAQTKRVKELNDQIIKIHQHGLPPLIINRPIKEE